MQKNKRMARARLALIALVLALTLLFTGRKINELAADPLGEKDCPPFSPSPADPQNQAKIIELPGQELPWKQKGGTLNDASCLNRTPVYGIVQVKTVEDIENAVLFASENNLKIAPAGVRHSMGGQAFYRGALVLDMTQFNQVAFDEAGQTVTVQSGATWHDIQNLLHPHYAVKAMQSTDIFTVGGSISVNAHGMDHQVGAIGQTIRSLRVMLPDGSLQTVSPSENRELFDLVVGGYGLFGIIVEAELEVVENVIYAPGRQVVDYQAFPALFEEQLQPNEKLGLFYGHLSTAPQSFLREMILYTYEEVAADEAEIAPLGEVSNTKLRRFVLNFSKLGAWPMRLKWFAEKYVEPRLESCSVNRNQAMKEGEACLVSRNQPMHDSVKYLKNNLPHETDILQEYYIPRAQFVPFVDGLRQIMLENEANLLNASVRVVHQEQNVLNYAPTEMFAVVLYLNQQTTPEENERMARVTEQVIDLALSLDGTFFLPYQLYYSPAQLERAYPQIEAFFAAKRRYDPELLLTNTFYETYAPHFGANQ